MMMMMMSLRTAIKAENEPILDTDVRRHVYALQQERRTTKRSSSSSLLCSSLLPHTCFLIEIAPQWSGFNWNVQATILRVVETQHKMLLSVKERSVPKGSTVSVKRETEAAPA